LIYKGFLEIKQSYRIFNDYALTYWYH